MGARAWAEACSCPELKNRTPEQLTRLFLCAEHFEDKRFTDQKEKTTLLRWKDIYSIPTLFDHSIPKSGDPNSGLHGSNPVLTLLMKGCTNSRLQKLCRLCSCLKPTQSLLPIYDSYYQSLIVKLRPFGIFQSLNDGLPSHICRTCAAKLSLCVETLEQFHESELKLKLAGSADISTITYDKPGIIDKIVTNIDSYEANQNNVSLSVSTRSQQDEPEKENLDSRNGLQVEEMKVNFIKTEVMDDENNTSDSSPVQDVSVSPFVKQEFYVEVPSRNEYNLEETSSQLPVSFIDFQNWNTISNEKEQTITVPECDPLSDEFRTTCKYCGRSFISIAFLMKHIYKEHSTDQSSPEIPANSKMKQYNCKVCNGMISSSIAYLSHLKMHAANTPGIEITKLRSEAFPSTHNKSFSKLVAYKDVDETKDSPRKFQKISLLRRSVQKDFKCDLCELSFSKKDELRLHFKTHKLFLCDTCRVKFYSEEDFREHIDIHKPTIADRYINKPFRIEFENAASIENIQAEANKTADEENNPEKCVNLKVETENEICFVDVPIKQEIEFSIIDIADGLSSRILESQEKKEAQISTRVNLWNVINENKIEFENREENKNTNAFIYVSDNNIEETDPYLKVAIEKVLADGNKMFVQVFDVKDLKCIICEEKFNTNSMLMTHLKSAHMFSCKQCNEEFQTQESLKIHLREAHRELKYICNLCGYHFSSQERIYEHMIVHKTEKTEKIYDQLAQPLRCKICNITLKTMYSMKCHMDKHRGVKNAFTCDKCDMRFDICSKLDEHRRKHEPKTDFDRPFVCTVCDSKFILETALRRHYLKEHSTNVTNG